MAAEFDASSFARRLAEAGVKPETAAGCAAAVDACVMTNLASKADIAALEARIEALRAEIGREADILFEALRKEIELAQPALTGPELQIQLSRLRRSLDVQISQLAMWCGIMLAIAVSLIVFFGWLL